MENPQTPPQAPTSPPPVPESQDPRQQAPPAVHAPEEPRTKQKRSPAIILVSVLLVGLIAGSIGGYAVTSTLFDGRLATVRTEMQSEFQLQLQNLPPQNATYVSYPNTTYVLNDNVSLAELYHTIRSSVVVIRDLVPQYNMFGYLVGYSQQQGSGFLALVNDGLVVVTNNHVTESASNITVTFESGDTYTAALIGADSLADLAVLSVSTLPEGAQPLTIVTSSSLHVGDPVVAVGSPYGLAGTLTTGVVSALGRTITEDDGTQNGLTIADVIQTSTPINPGNSGGPLINYQGEVVGITTAAVSSSEGLGFAIPSDTILREISSLVTSGAYTDHPSIHATGIDMTYQIAQAMNTNVTYGWLVESVSVQNGLQGGSTQATVLGSRVIIGGDIITAISGTRITSTDDLLSYIEEHTLPNQTVNFTVYRSGQLQTIQIAIGKVN
jgi:S1-C subfamily serine protease